MPAPTGPTSRPWPESMKAQAFSVEKANEQWWSGGATALGGQPKAATIHRFL